MNPLAPLPHLPHAATARPKTETTLPAATSTVDTPLKDNFDARFERVLATVRANRPHDDLDIIRHAWPFCLRTARRPEARLG